MDVPPEGDHKISVSWVPRCQFCHGSGARTLSGGRGTRDSVDLSARRAGDPGGSWRSAGATRPVSARKLAGADTEVS